MGRSNLIILCFGIFACIALSLMMNHAVTIKDKRDVHPSVIEVHGLFGDQMTRRPKLEIETEGRRRQAVVTLWPKSLVGSERLAQMIGRHLARYRGPDLRFDSLEVVAVDPEDPSAPGKSIPVPVPRMAVRSHNPLLPQRMKRDASKDAAPKRKSGQPRKARPSPPATKTPGPPKRP